MSVTPRFGEGHRVLVSGGAGFVPSHLVDLLIGRGCQVVAIDNFVTGAESNVRHLIDNPLFTLVKADIADGLPAEPALMGRFDAILHMASPASPVDFSTLPVEILRVGSLATFHLLDRAREDNARFLLASTSEAYGDPLVHPQPETYWGNVNPVGVRSVYDESKRFAEAATMAYRRTYGVDTGIVRIFNSILADEMVLFDDGETLHHEPIEALAKRLGSTTAPLSEYAVPAFGSGGAVRMSEATWLVGHPTQAPCYRVTTGYGRSVAVTGDHSLFVRGEATGAPEARAVSALNVGDRIAISSRVDVIERDRKKVSMFRVIEAAGVDPWDLAISWSGLGEVIHEHRHDLVGLIPSRRDGSSRQSSWGTLHRWRAAETAPLAALQHAGIGIGSAAIIRRYSAGAKAWLPVEIELCDELLWLMGLFVAEGCLRDQRPNEAFLTISCDEQTLDRAEEAIRRNLGLHVVRAAPSAARSGAIFVHSQLLLDLWAYLGLAGREKRIPGWVLSLPLDRLKWFVEGYREGDGVNSGKKLAEGIRHEFSTVSTGLKDDLVVAFARFGLVPSVGRYESTFRQRTGDRRYPSWRITLCNVTPWSPLQWDLGVEQKLAAERHGDLVWASVNAIEEVPATTLVYDFCVPGKENFWAGSGVMAHNTYGPRMRANDGRFIPTFISQALRGEPVTVHGNGEQTRSICYVDDLVRGILLLLDSHESGPINCGTEYEMSVMDLAKKIIELSGSSSEIVLLPRTPDDPERRRPDLTLARTRLGFEPTVGPDEGLRATIDYFRSL